LGENLFYGVLPGSIGTLENLVFLDVSDNSLIGSIPESIWNLPDLADIWLDHNGLTGSILNDLGALQNLKSIDLSFNDLEGDIPESLWELPNLEFIILKENEFTGIIPSSVGSLTNLIHIDIGFNNLSGELPPEIGMLPELQVLDLDGNDLDGFLPEEIGDLQQITRLVLSDNEFSGPFPLNLTNATTLAFLDLSVNNLFYPIPEEIENLSNLHYLSLSHNNFSGEIPPEIGNLPNLQKLYLNYNNLTGAIPTALENLSNLEWIYLNNNNLSGSIPPELGNLSNLEYLHLSGNSLTGSIPSELGNLHELEQLMLGINQLSGALPPELGNLTDLKIIFLAFNQLTGCFPPEYEIFCTNIHPNNANFQGNPGLPGGGDFEAFCDTGAGNCNYTITGDVVYDQNLNCQQDTLEEGLQNWMVAANSVTGDFYGWTDSSGHYTIYAAPGFYQMDLVFPGPYWEENCTGDATVFIEEGVNYEVVDYYPEALIECPFLTVDISSPFLRRCFDNYSVVQYCNNGTAPAEDAYIEVIFDELLTVDSATVDFEVGDDNVYLFNVGNVGVNDCGTFIIYTYLSCDAILGETICSEAHIFPDSLCQEISPEWSGATVEITGECTGEEVKFTVRNTGSGDMLMDGSYIVIEDGIILYSEPQPFILPSGDDFDLNFEANGSTYVCQATQVANHPINFLPTASIEGCGTNDDGEFSTGFVTQFPEGDGAPFLSIDCQEVIGAYDPNDKNGYPKGVGEERFIDVGQDVEYRIRFQNTGTDTAFTVIIEDVLSSHWDMESLRLGASSHPYELEIRGDDTLRFVFNNILLPDSTANEPASHGFIKFKISQQPELPLGTIIENEAAIFFDFNEPVITNTTVHRLGEDYLGVVGVNSPVIPGLEVSVSPNPFSETTSIYLSGIEFEEAQLTLYNAQGMLVDQQSFSTNKYSLNRGSLAGGIYWFEITLDGEKGYFGKMVIN
ncbi:MAG: T9SS C-terminal target domain-containing protein, partial [Bacteroidetes bacterium]